MDVLFLLKLVVIQVGLMLEGHFISQLLVSERGLFGFDFFNLYQYLHSFWNIFNKTHIYHSWLTKLVNQASNSFDFGRDWGGFDRQRRLRARDNMTNTVNGDSDHHLIEHIKPQEWFNEGGEPQGAHRPYGWIGGAVLLLRFNLLNDSRVACLFRLSHSFW